MLWACQQQRVPEISNYIWMGHYKHIKLSLWHGKVSCIGLQAWIGCIDAPYHAFALDIHPAMLFNWCQIHPNYYSKNDDSHPYYILLDPLLKIILAPTNSPKCSCANVLWISESSAVHLPFNFLHPSHHQNNSMTLIQLILWIIMRWLLTLQKPTMT